MDDLVAIDKGAGRQNESDEALRRYVLENAWGHHACGTSNRGTRVCSRLPVQSPRSRGLTSRRRVGLSPNSGLFSSHGHLHDPEKADVILADS